MTSFRSATMQNTLQMRMLPMVMDSFGLSAEKIREMLALRVMHALGGTVEQRMQMFAPSTVVDGDGEVAYIDLMYLIGKLTYVSRCLNFVRETTELLTRNVEADGSPCMGGGVILARMAVCCAESLRSGNTTGWWPDYGESAAQEHGKSPYLSVRIDLARMNAQERVVLRKHFPWYDPS